MEDKMDTAIISAIGAIISAGCALFTLYMYRQRGKGFIWTKDQKIGMLTNKKGDVHLQVEIPLFNLGKGNIRFLKLRAKKINLQTKAMENYELDMDEAYFPEGVQILIYRTPIIKFPNDKSKTDQVVFPTNPEKSEIKNKKIQERINKQISEIPEHIIILKCTYKDGSWFGFQKKTTVIGLSVHGVKIAYLSSERRRELNSFFSW
jgi:hypothetical protein